MEEKKNNAVEKVENAIDYAGEDNFNGKDENKADIRNGENLFALREQRKIERQKASSLRYREKTRIKEQKLLKAREESKRAHQLKAQMLRARQEEKEKRMAERRKDKERNRGKGGYLAAIISLGIATLVLSSVLTFTFLMPTESDNALEASYQRAFHNTVEQVSNMDLNLSKTLATKDYATMQGYLLDLAVNSELAESNIGELPLHDENKYYTTKLINQIGDFAKYLSKKLANGENLSKSDKDALKRLQEANASLKDTLYKSLSNMNGDFSFAEMDSEKGNFLVENLNELENLSVQYPELIYDGPFSDGLESREIKGLKGSEINEASAKDEFIKIFGNYGLTDVEVIGESKGLIECYNVSAKVEGESLYSELSKKGGNLIMFEYQGSCGEVNYLEENARETAEEFLVSLGIDGMRVVWSTLSNNVYTFNFAFEDNGVIVYSDLIKVRVCAETRMVIGFEASSYYMNHTERLIPTPVITEATAREYVLEDIEVNKGRLALIPIGNTLEKLCYEFEGNVNGQTFYIYIDANSGRQVEMFKLVESSDGNLLM